VRSASREVVIGGRVAEANLIRKVEPVYPTAAKAIGVQGVVRFTAHIGANGTVSRLELVSGHPLLVNAAREAVLQWGYRPVLLSGQPVAVVTDIVVNFTFAP
jgi:protein TonB